MWIEKRKLLELWDAAHEAGDEVSLATIVRVEGSSYRKPGATMLLTRSGMRAGMVSGGCLEGEVGKKIWWLTESGACVETYTTSFDDDGEGGHGLGCGGRISLLLERGVSAKDRIEAIRQSLVERKASAIATVIGEGVLPVGTRVVLNDVPVRVEQNGTLGPRLGNELEPSPETRTASASVVALRAAAEKTLRQRCSFVLSLAEGQAAFAEYIAPPPLLFVFGAGDDAQPVAGFAAAMGWEVVVADGRSHLATSVRFPTARVMVLSQAGLGALWGQSGAVSVAGSGMPREAAAVVMTHSYEQDRAILAAILPLNPMYVGVLGPRRRTSQLLDEVSGQLPGSRSAEDWLEQLHSPAGLDLGADGPEVVALSIIAEVQATLEGRMGMPLRLLRSPLIASDD